MEYVNILKSPFVLEGLAVKEEGKLWRLPENLVDNVNERITDLKIAKGAAGACVRFRTDSKKIYINVVKAAPCTVVNANMAVAHGADAYFDGEFAGMIRPDYGKTEYTGEISRPWYLEAGVCDVRVDLPIAGPVLKMEIGLDDGASLLPPTPHKIKKPVVFYGSSITQGYHASRPGCTYVTQLARRLDFELINLGFSGAAHGEQNVAEYIASLDMSVFVLDYDHNDDVPDLLSRHEPFFKTVRAKHPDLPVIMLTRPDFEYKALNREDRDAVYATYKHATDADDKNVYYIDGEEFYGKTERGDYTLDGIHPNDLGMRSMADRVYPLLSKLLYNE